MQPTVNVNLKSCSCEPGTAKEWTECSAAPVLIPCPIPRSVTFEVQVRDCGHKEGHPITCPWPVGYVVKVSCSISGETWEESEVADVEKRGDQWLDQFEEGAALRICRERWALVKALLLHHGEVSGHTVFTPESLPLLQQRDAVFSALSDMARAEEAAMAAQQRVDEAFPSDRYARQGDTDHRAVWPSVNRLARYVERLVEQVGVME